MRTEKSFRDLVLFERRVFQVLNEEQREQRRTFILYSLNLLFGALFFWGHLKERGWMTLFWVGVPLARLWYLYYSGCVARYIKVKRNGIRQRVSNAMETYNLTLLQKSGFGFGKKVPIKFADGIFFLEIVMTRVQAVQELFQRKDCLIHVDSHTVSEGLS